MRSPHESRLYHGLSFCYDAVFSPFLKSRIHSTIRGLGIPAGARVLELGVGTGISLPAYPRHAEIVAVDVSDQMLRRARRVVRRHQLRHVHLHAMNALELDFADATFDYVMAFHILSVVKDSRRLLREMTRVGKSSGVIVIINHLRRGDRWLTRLVDAFDPLAQRMGWQTKLTYEQVVDAARLNVVQCFKTSPRSLFTVVICEKGGWSPAERGDRIRHEPGLRDVAPLARPALPTARLEMEWCDLRTAPSNGALDAPCFESDRVSPMTPVRCGGLEPLHTAKPADPTLV
jgi:phosphatidylethanolamine/phosphatidyl-N-methylethanolamine N-methyltransferase